MTGISTKILALAFVLLWKWAVSTYIPPATKANTTILISFDGFRWDYMSKTDTPNLDFLVKTGVKAPYINPVFPTETIPNHYSMVTGLYPESHGILSGYYTYDPVWNSTFTMSTNESRWWEGGEPVWVTNQKQGHKSGVCYFPGYDISIKGYLPSYSSMDTGYDKAFLHSQNHMSHEGEVDLVLSWMKSPNPPTFIALYFNEPDETSHEFGPNSFEVVRKIKRCDNITGYLLKRLKENNFLETTNLILTSDHGHSSYNTSFFLDFDDYISQDNYTRHGTTTVQIWPKVENELEYVYKRFKKMQDETKHVSVFKTKEIPDEFHFKNNRRAPPIVAILDEHWIGNNTGFWKYWKSVNRTNQIYGEHSYNPSLKSMKPFFIARGPSFKEGFVTKPFDMVDIYPLLCHVLGIAQAPNNGSFNRVQELLKGFQVRDSIPARWGSFFRQFFTSIWQAIGAML